MWNQPRGRAEASESSDSAAWHIARLAQFSGDQGHLLRMVGSSPRGLPQGLALPASPSPAQPWHSLTHMTLGKSVSLVCGMRRGILPHGGGIA